LTLEVEPGEPCRHLISAAATAPNAGEEVMSNSSSRRRFLAASGAALALGAAGRAHSAQAQGVPIVKVMTFPGLTNFPIFAAQHKGLFAKHGIAIEHLYTPNSRTQREGLAKGDHQIIQTAADNPVAMVEMAKSDAIIVTGGDNGFNRIIVQPEINSLQDLRGKTVVVDAPNTAFAFLLYKALKDVGLNKGDYAVNSVGGTDQRFDAMTKDKKNAAGIMGLPFVFRATAAGFKDLGPAYQTIGAYQSDCAAVMRDWAKANSDTLIRYIRAVVEGRRWLLDPANKAEATQLIVDRLRLAPDIAARSYEIVTHPTTGMAKDAKFDMAGFQNVLKLRAEIEGQWGGNPPPPDKYIDLSYYDKALAGL
jgi:ABC-type nitrate/sulfonate/bicarbonate transport system substrate-binding protein